MVPVMFQLGNETFIVPPFDLLYYRVFLFLCQEDTILVGLMWITTLALSYRVVYIRCQWGKVGKTPVDP